MAVSENLGMASSDTAVSEGMGSHGTQRLEG
jgi:hypothetical protein